MVMKTTVRIEYTVESRGRATRKAKEVLVERPERVELEIERLIRFAAKKDAYNIEVKCEVCS